MRIGEENWKVLVSLFPPEWQKMAWRSGAVQRLRGLPSSDVLLRMLLLHVARGYSLRETVVRAKLANWADISDVALLKRLRNSEEWLRLLCIELLRENVAYHFEEAIGPTIRIVDGTIVREPGKTGSQWRILYSIRLPSLVCDFFEVTATIGEGSGESLNRLPVGPHELILADAGYCSIAGIEYVCQNGADVLVRVNPQSFVAYSAYGRRISLLPRLRTLSKVGQFGEWRVVLHGQDSAFAGRLCAVRKSDCAIQQAHRRLQRKASKKQVITRPGTFEFAKYVIVFTTRSSGSTSGVLRSYRMRWQIELEFKRLKSLAQLGHVPKHDDRSSRACLYGKTACHAPGTKIDRHRARHFPLGLPTPGAGDHVVRRVNSVSRCTRSSKLSNAPLLAANALFVESDCTGSCGKVAQPTTSISEMAHLVNTTPRPTDPKTHNLFLSTSDFGPPSSPKGWRPALSGTAHLLIYGQ